MGKVVRGLELRFDSLALPVLSTLLLLQGCSGLPRHAWSGPPVPASAWSSHLDDGTRVRVRPLPFGPERTAATLDYVRERYADPGADSVGFVPKMVVVHWTAIPTLRRTWDAFAPETLDGERPDIATAGRVNVSSQFLIDRDGTIYQLLPETVIARHVIGLNRVAIGIENVGGPEAPLTPAQLDANAALIGHLARKYPTIRYLIGHLEYTNWEGSSLWEERDPGYRTEKTDPGEDFLATLRVRLAPLGLLAAEPADG